jgi:hypothetical protein
MKSRFTVLRKPVLACAIASLSIGVFANPSSALADSAKRMPMRVVSAGVDQEARKAERQAYHQWLLSERVPAASRNPLVLRADADELAAVDEAPKQSPELVGFTQDVHFDASFRDLKASKLRGRSQQLQNGAVERISSGGYA